MPIKNNQQKPSQQKNDTPENSPEQVELATIQPTSDFLITDSHSTSTGTRFEKEQKKLNEGGMAQVFKANDTKEEKTVVLKQFKGGGSRQAEREFETLKNVGSHPNIVEALEVYNGMLVLEFIEGKTLRYHLNNKPKNTRPNLGWIKQIMFPLIDAVNHTHNKGFAHLDLKPENIMVTDDGNVKIIDFGMAHPLGESLREASEQGTYFYTAPECILAKTRKKQDKITTAADVYSLGAILYELLTYEQTTGKPGPIKNFYLNKDWQPLLQDWDIIIDNTLAAESADRWSLPKLKKELRIRFNAERNATLSKGSHISQNSQWLVGFLLLVALLSWSVNRYLFQPPKQLTKTKSIPPTNANRKHPSSLASSKRHTVNVRLHGKKRTSINKNTRPHIERIPKHKDTKPRTKQVSPNKNKKPRIKRIPKRKRTRANARRILQHKKSIRASAPSPRQTASLKVMIYPPCRLFTIGNGLPHNWGMTAFGKKLTLQPGSHNFRCVGDGGKFIHNFQVRLNSGEHKTYQRLFKQGTLIIQSSPWAKISMKGYGDIGRSNEPIRLYEGKYRLHLFKKGNPNHKQSVQILVQPEKATKMSIHW